MVRVALSAGLVAMLAAVASGDSLILTDGRTFTGTVAVEGDTVLITLPHATLRFSKSAVERIELKATPEQQFRKKLGETALDDPNALFSLAEWAGRNGLDRRAADLYALILRLEADHAPTRRVLGYVRVQKQWLPIDKAVEQARGMLEAGRRAALLDDVLPALKGAASTREQHNSIAELLGQTQLRSRLFSAASETFAALAKKLEPPAAVRIAAIATILEEHADGMYVLREAYPPTARLLGGGASASIQPGPASLSLPKVLEAALRDLAKKQIATGRKLMDEARKLARTDPDPAALKYAQADQAFVRADALVAGIARSHRVEICRRRIASIRKDADVEARKFDELWGKLGVRDMSPQALREMVRRMMHLLDNTSTDLGRALAIAKCYPRELVLEVEWAELDLTTVQRKRTVLVKWLDDTK